MMELELLPPPYFTVLCRMALIYQSSRRVEYQSKGQAVFTKGEREREDSKSSNDRLEVERREERMI